MRSEKNNTPYNTYVFDDAQANLIKALLVPNRVETVKALAVMQAQINAYEYTLKTVLLAYDKTIGRALDTQRTLEFAKTVNVLYEQELKKRKQLVVENAALTSSLQALLNGLGAAVGDEEEKTALNSKFADVVSKLTQGD